MVPNTKLSLLRHLKILVELFNKDVSDLGIFLKERTGAYCRLASSSDECWTSGARDECKYFNPKKSIYFPKQRLSLSLTNVYMTTHSGCFFLLFFLIYKE